VHDMMIVRRAIWIWLQHEGHGSASPLRL